MFVFKKKDLQRAKSIICPCNGIVWDSTISLTSTPGAAALKGSSFPGVLTEWVAIEDFLGPAMDVKCWEFDSHRL